MYLVIPPLSFLLFDLLWPVGVARACLGVGVARFVAAAACCMPVVLVVWSRVNVYSAPRLSEFLFTLLLLDTCTRTHGSRWRKLYRSPIITGLLSISHSLVSRLPLYCIHVVVRPPFSASLVFQDFYLNCDEGLYLVGFRLAHMYSCTCTVQMY